MKKYKPILKDELNGYHSQMKKMNRIDITIKRHKKH